MKDVLKVFVATLQCLYMMCIDLLLHAAVRSFLIGLCSDLNPFLSWRVSDHCSLRCCVTLSREITEGSEIPRHQNQGEATLQQKPEINAMLILYRLL